MKPKTKVAAKKAPATKSVAKKPVATKQSKAPLQTPSKRNAAQSKKIYKHVAERLAKHAPAILEHVEQIAKADKAGKVKRTEHEAPEPTKKRSTKKVDAPQAPPRVEKPKPYIHKDLLSGWHYFSFEDMMLPIDDENLARTIGAGQYGYGRGVIDRWSDEVWKRILRYLELPSEPLVREVAANPIRRLVQSTWLEKFDGRAFELNATVYKERDKVAAAVYTEAHENVKNVTEEKRERAVKNLVGLQRSKTDLTYTPTQALKDPKLVFTGQPQLILGFWRKVKYAPAKLQQIADAVLAAGLKTSQPPERVVTHYLNIWRSKGYVEAE